MNGKKMLRMIRKHPAFRRLRRFIRINKIVILPVMVLLILMTVTYFTGKTEGDVFRREDNRTLLVSTTEAEEQRQKQQSPYVGLQGMLACAEEMEHYAHAAAVIDTVSENETVLVGATGISRQRVQQEAIRNGMRRAGELIPSAMQLVRERQMPPEEYDTLLHIVEAEATGDDVEGKRLIANVILNRVKDPRFPDTIQEVVWQQEDGIAQFQPTVDGRISSLEITDTTIQAVDEALMGTDLSQGALFFMARNGSEEQNIDWFDQNLSVLFTHGAHEYFTYKTSV